MELRQLEYFVAVAEEANFTRAAARLHVVQSAVSSTIKNLERELRTPLLERTPKRVLLTDAGAALLPRAHAALDAAREGADAVGEVRSGVRGTLRLGAITTVGLIDLPVFLGEFHRRHPGVFLQTSAAPSGSQGLVEALLERRLDLAFVSGPGPHPTGITLTDLATSVLDLVVPADHPLAKRRTLSITELAGLDFVDFPAGHYALVTSLLDHRTHPAGELIALYHERWEIESSYLALRHTLLHGRVLRSMDPAGLEQELWSLLTLYQVLRHAMVDAARSRPDLDPDRVSFTAAASTAQATVVRAAGTADQHDPAPPRAIATAVLAHPLPARRGRLSARKVKSPISRYAGRPLEERPLTSTRITGIDIDVENPGATPRPELSPAVQTKIMKPGSRVDRVFALLGTTPDRTFTPSELAQALGITNINSFSVQLGSSRPARQPSTRQIHDPGRTPFTSPLTCADKP
ncbi:LysR substrate-binding domain-containing protein [Actinacidiphila glaucinigra]